MKKYEINEWEKQHIEEQKQIASFWEHEELLREYGALSLAYQTNLKVGEDNAYYAALVNVYKDEIIHRMNRKEEPYDVYDEQEKRVLFEGSHNQCATYLEALYLNNAENYPYAKMRKCE